MNTIFIVIALTRRILNCISAKRRENHAPAPPVSWPPLTEDPIRVAYPESQGSFWLWFLQADIIENSYLFITHILLSMHVHFLMITNIHISGIFSKLVSQCASVRMTQFFYILTYNIHVKVYCHCLTLNCYCPTVVVWTVTVQQLLSNRWCLDIELLLSNCCCPTIAVWTVTAQRLLSNRCCLNCYWPTVAVQPFMFEHSSDF